MTRVVFIVSFFLMGFSSTIAQVDSDPQAAARRAWDRLNDVTRGDLLFFFDVISFRNGHWEFKLSPNVRGMLWRIRKGSSDVTGACNSGQVLEVPFDASLLIHRGDLDLFFEPWREPAGFRIRMSIEPGGQSGKEIREAYLQPHGAGFSLIYARL